MTGSPKFLEYDGWQLSSKHVNADWSIDDTVTTSFSEDFDENDDCGMNSSSSLGVGGFSCHSIKNTLWGDDDDDYLEGLPRDVLVVDEDAMCMDESKDVYQRLQIAETLAQSLKAKMKSTEQMTDCLHDYLRQAQTYAEDVLADRNELLKEVEAMHEEVQKQMDQQVLLKVLMGSSLCYYMCGGTPFFLTCSVGLSLLVDFMNVIF